MKWEPKEDLPDQGRVVIRRFQDNYAIEQVCLNLGARGAYTCPTYEYLDEIRKKKFNRLKALRKKQEIIIQKAKDNKLEFRDALDRWQRYKQEIEFLAKERVMTGRSGVNDAAWEALHPKRDTELKPLKEETKEKMRVLRKEEWARRKDDGRTVLHKAAASPRKPDPGIAAAVQRFRVKKKESREDEEGDRGSQQGSCTIGEYLERLGREAEVSDRHSHKRLKPPATRDELKKASG